MQILSKMLEKRQLLFMEHGNQFLKYMLCSQLLFESGEWRSPLQKAAFCKKIDFRAEQKDMIETS